MSRENVETILELPKAYERGGTEAALELVASDFELTMPFDYPGSNRAFHGGEAARQAVEDWIDSFEDFPSRDRLTNTAQRGGTASRGSARPGEIPANRQVPDTHVTARHGVQNQLF